MKSSKRNLKDIGCGKKELCHYNRENILREYVKFLFYIFLHKEDEILLRK